jgi:hypothetical protein
LRVEKSRAIPDAKDMRATFTVVFLIAARAC